jgi:phosphomevalonate kinase
MKNMGDRAGVPIEPAEQTQLLDLCMEIPGVIMAGVPGAGGNDAIFCICLGGQSKSLLLDLWAKRKDTITPLLADIDRYGGLRVLESNCI